MAQPDVVCLGEAMVEVALNRTAPDTARIGFAGDTFNTAVYLKRTAPDLRVAYATKIGADTLSDRLLAMMDEERIDTRFVLRSPSAMPGLYAISTDDRGERSFMYWRSASAARALFAPPALDLDHLAMVPMLYFSAISLAILPEADRDNLLRWLPAYRAGGGRVAFDSNYRPALWPDPQSARRCIESAWRNCDIGLPSVDDEMDLFGDGDEDAVLARLRGWGVVRGALKRGEKGPRPLTGAACGAFARAPRVIDSTAAGDSFNAAYLATLLTGGDDASAQAAGHALASEVIGERGAILPRSPGGGA